MKKIIIWWYKTTLQHKFRVRIYNEDIALENKYTYPMAYYQAKCYVGIFGGTIVYDDKL